TGGVSLERRARNGIQIPRRALVRCVAHGSGRQPRWENHVSGALFLASPGWVHVVREARARTRRGRTTGNGTGPAWGAGSRGWLWGSGLRGARRPASVLQFFRGGAVWVLVHCGCGARSAGAREGNHAKPALIGTPRSFRFRRHDRLGGVD